MSLIGKTIISIALIVAIAVGVFIWDPMGNTSEAEPPGGETGDPAAAEAFGKRPNVLLILSDDQPLKTMSAMPRTKRWFGQEGVKFPHAFATTPTCCPSRASILTGRYAHNHGVLNNADAPKLDSTLTITRALRNAGYRTGIFGKYFNSMPIEDKPRHFDEWAIFNVPGAYYNRNWNVNGKVRRIAEYSTTYIGDRTLEFMKNTERRDDQPWFAYVTPSAPHSGFTAEPKYQDAPVTPWTGRPSLYEGNPNVDPGGFSDKPQYIQDAKPKKGRRLRKNQLRTLVSVDDMNQRLRAKLRRLGEEENTLVFYMSDNGYLWGDHNKVSKFVPYTPSIKVPLYMSWPALVEGGRTDRRLTANIDLPTTILEAAGIAGTTPALDGRSLVDQSWTRDRMLTESFVNVEAFTTDLPPWASLRDNKMQYVEYYGEGGEIVFREYYDLKEDPFQLLNLLGDDDTGNDPPAEELEALHVQLEADRRCAGPACP